MAMGNWNTYSLFVGVEIDAVTMEISLEVPQMTENRSYSRETWPSIFITTLSTLARKWKQTSCSWTVEWIMKIKYIYTMESYSAIKKNCNSEIHREMDRSRNNHCGWGNLDVEKQTPHFSSHLFILALKF